MPCRTETIAPHIRVLYRDIPYILNIKKGHQSNLAPVLTNLNLLSESNNFSCTWAFLTFPNFVFYLLAVIKCCITISLYF